MKYYFAVIHCNSKETAEKLYNECNGIEFELSNIHINLSFIDDDLVLPQKPQESVTSLDPTYRYDTGKINQALNSTKVKLTWD
mmetsp:Transcript_18397/g.13384  ORF Transcript_18397/g.13384 Transcript_18397/m.13384 type:complete len:83 (-) Transcript_18397:103-351(-)